MPISENPWVVTIVGGLIVYFLTRGRSSKSGTPISVDSLLGILVFLVLQVGIPVFEPVSQRFINEFGYGVWVFFYEMIAIIVTVLTIEARKKRRDG